MRIAAFIDYWNFQLTLNENIDKKQGCNGSRAKIDWRSLGSNLAQAACPILSTDASKLSYEGCYIYTSYNPLKDSGKNYKRWVTTWLDRQPGVNVELRERKVKGLPKCPVCHREITNCPHNACGERIVATVEKGVDTLLVTDLIRLGLSDSYDAAVIASLDADLVPAVKFVQSSGKKVIQAGFPPKGIELSTECWGSFNVMDISDQTLRD